MMPRKLTLEDIYGEIGYKTVFVGRRQINVSGTLESRFFAKIEPLTGRSMVIHDTTKSRVLRRIFSADPSKPI